MSLRIAACILVGFFPVICVACDGDAARGTNFHGTKLGMTPSDVRAHFDESAAGDWNADSSAADYRLRWISHHGMSSESVHTAQFEFHDGQLVAVRAEIPDDDPLASTRGVRVTDLTVVERKNAPESSVSYLMLARTCPTHRDEVQRVLAASH